MIEQAEFETYYARNRRHIEDVHRSATAEGWVSMSWVDDLLYHAAICAEHLPDGDRNFELLSKAVGLYLQECADGKSIPRQVLSDESSPAESDPTAASGEIDRSAA